jgi:hypothetical protein
VPGLCPTSGVAGRRDEGPGTPCQATSSAGAGRRPVGVHRNGLRRSTSCARRSQWFRRNRLGCSAGGTWPPPLFSSVFCPLWWPVPTRLWITFDWTTSGVTTPSRRSPVPEKHPKPGETRGCGGGLAGGGPRPRGGATGGRARRRAMDTGMDTGPGMDTGMDTPMDTVSMSAGRSRDRGRAGRTWGGRRGGLGLETAPGGARGVAIYSPGAGGGAQGGGRAAAAGEIGRGDGGYRGLGGGGGENANQAGRRPARPG